MNKLVVIGWLGSKLCFINLPAEECITRYLAEENINRQDFDALILERPDLVREYSFDDQFYAYDAFNV